ncbi:MAG: 1-(5-phosphoribosyl)-5-[(5-phosphoribosylamino)methylideneamino]imidazole-4-carboxamide isomerase [Lentisphaerae bacterium]|jgi:phosphoribosylformimino-5-aminoimidazole carboxamide ribotide isomerase|nr:1-(5-phosphoribosyl)-5-[(5-phosphoribosylamino)methylideneamino]imidazole-4-carboxamide isomerase [Lentisphaerota bacterium]
MVILPAIDLKNGRCVRLLQGRAADETVYSDDPLAMARRWHDEGAVELHVVDLDGAFNGRPAHADVIAEIVRTCGMAVEVGGGLRDDSTIETLMAAGVSRAILGTRAWAEPKAMARLVKRFGDRIAVGIDARDGFVQVKGWVETTDLRATDLARRAADAGVATIIYTDTATDGMLKGPNIRQMDQICTATPECRIIASGGVSAPDHITALRALGHPNLYGAIVGKALYDNKTTLAAMLAAANA